MSKPTTVRFEDEEALRLEQLARRQGTTVSALIQKAVRKFYLERDRAQAVDELLAFVRAESHPVEQTLAEMEDRIVEGMGDAAGG